MSVFDLFENEQRWIAWRNEKRGGKLTKVPYGAGGKPAKANDPATWLTRAEAIALAKHIANGLGGGIGLELGDLGGDRFIVGFDLDSCIDENGCLAPWAEKILVELDTYAETSPSGTGVKAFFYLSAEHVRPFLELIGVTEPDKWGIKRSVGEDGRDHGPGVEIYCARRYFAVTDKLWPGKPDDIRLLDWPQLQRVARLVPSAHPPNEHSQSATRRDGGRDTSRSAIAFRKGAALRRAGKTFEEVVDTLQRDPDTADWCREKGEAFNMRELRRIWEHAKPISAQSSPAAFCTAVPIGNERPKALHPAADEELLRQLRIDIGQLNDESPPEAVTAIVDRIAACATDEIMREALLKTVKAQTDTSVRSMLAHIDRAAKAARKKPARSGQDWRDSLSRNRDGEPYATASNVLIALRGAPQWQGVLALNEFNQRPMLVGKPPWTQEWDKPRPFSDADEARTLVWMQENGIPLCRMEAVHQALAVAIDDNRYHPVRDYLEALVWDGKPRLDWWLTYFLGVKPIEHYTSPVGRCWMISAVARIYQPGCQAKYCLVLEGDQDLGKSTALEVLGGEWYTDDIAELGTKDSAMQAGNAWIVELAELDSVRKAHIAAVKAFISRKVDRFRKPFGRYIISQERQCILAASINPGAEYLADETGNVRFCAGFRAPATTRPATGSKTGV
jgi:hypothetical protein